MNERERERGSERGEGNEKEEKKKRIRNVKYNKIKRRVSQAHVVNEM